MNYITARIAATLVSPDPFLRWLNSHTPDAAVGINASVEHNMIACFLREALSLPKGTIKVYPHKIEVLIEPSRQAELVILPAWCASTLTALARSIRPLTILSAGDMHRVTRIVRAYWVNRIKQHYWGGLRNPSGYHE